MLNFLSDVLYDYCKLNSLELQSADDILYTERITEDQRLWLKSYIELWDIAEQNLWLTSHNTQGQVLMGNK